MSRIASLAVCLILLLHSFASAQVKLERKVAEGSTYTVERVIRFEQKLSIAGMDTETSNETRVTAQSTVGQRDGLGMLRVEEKIQALQVNMTVMGSNYFFDSANPDKAGTSALEILRELHKALARQTTTIVYDKDNRVEAVSSDQDVLNNVPEAVRNLAKSQLDPEYLKKVANQELDKLPSEPVSKGDSWQRSEPIDLGGGQVMTFHNRYTYEGTVEKDGRTLDKISLEVLKVDFALQNSPLPITLKSSQLKPAESAGTILFDREQGRTVESTSNVRITGELTFVAGDQDLPSKLDLKMESSTIIMP
jgi:hypothetical protein